MTRNAGSNVNGDRGEAAFRTHGACREYDGRVVLAPLDLHVAAGERLAVIGPSGAGKTTLLRLLGAVLWPTRGSVTTLGRDTTTLRGRALRELRRDVGFLHQHDNLVPGLRVAHNVLMGHLGRWSTWTAIRSLFAPRQLDSAVAALRQVELENALWSLPSQLSGGEQQRVAIARLMLQEPRALLADEPVSSLDIRLGRDVIERLCALARDRNASLVVSLHTLDLLGHFDRVLALREGQRVWEGAPAELTTAILADVYGTEYRTLRLQEMDLDGMDLNAP